MVTFPTLASRMSDIEQPVETVLPGGVAEEVERAHMAEVEREVERGGDAEREVERRSGEERWRERWRGKAEEVERE